MEPENPQFERPEMSDMGKHIMRTILDGYVTSGYMDINKAHDLSKSLDKKPEDKPDEK